MARSTWLWWSGGKDSAWALNRLLDDPAFHVTGLVTTVDPTTDRVAMQGVGRTLLELQASAVGLPLYSVDIPWPSSNDVYARAVAEVIERARDEAVDHMSFGDIHLADLRAWREGLFSGLGVELHFPLWAEPTPSLATEMIDGGLVAHVTAVDPLRVDPGFLGCRYDAAFLHALDPGVDPCGENGEFHTFASGGPMFMEPLAVAMGQAFDEGPLRCVEAVLEYPIDGTLDLHAIPPREVGALVDDYLDACRDRGILQVRVVHGKGTGALRETVHARLRRRSDVRSFRLGGAGEGEWGATMVELEPRSAGTGKIE